MDLFEIVSGEIRNDGPISFSRYMELALYHPDLGFYAGGGAGRRRDFITSPEVGPLFGAVLANALDRWWDGLERPDHFALVDVGAGPGTLARAIQSAEPRCLASLEYIAVDVSPEQRAHHPDTAVSLERMPAHVGEGVVLANELVDNLPFDVAQYTPAEGWCEVRVGLGGAELVEVLEPLSTSPCELPAGKPEGAVRVPIQRRAAYWLEEALAVLSRGRVVIFDYSVESYPCEPERTWLRTYNQHGHAGSPYDHPGSKDITADVDLASLARVHEPTARYTQSDWLVKYGIVALVEEGKAHWHKHAAAPDLAAMAMRSRVSEAEALLDPAGLGAFSVVEWTVGE